MKLEITNSLLKILNNQNSKKFLSKTIKVVLKFLEKYFGSELLIKIPAELYGIDNKLLKAIKTASKLQNLGIIKNIIKQTKYSDEPFFYNYKISCPNKAYGGGVDFLNEEKAIWKAIAEATERYIWYNSDYFYKNHLLKKPYKEIKNRALNIFNLAGFSHEQKNKFSFLKFDENTIFNWVPANSLNSNKKIFLPIQLVSALYFSKKRLQEKEPMLRWCITTGLATGQTLEEAIVKGILEVIERDAFMISYLNKLSPPIIDLTYLANQDEEINKIIKNFQRYNLEIYLLQLPTDFSEIYITCALIIDQSGLGPTLSVGASADFDQKTAILDALSESFIVRYSLKKKFTKTIDIQNIKREERLIYWAKNENLPKIKFFFKGEKIKIDLDKNFYQNQENQNLKKYYKEKLEFLKKELKKKNYEACYIELTTKEVKILGLRVVQVVIPELQPLHLEESIPYFGGKRLKEVPLKLGYQPAETLNQIPHPFP